MKASVHGQEQNPITNAVIFFQKNMRLSIEDAMVAVKTKSIELENEYLQSKASAFSKGIACQDAEATALWFSGLENLVSGLHVWGLYSPRYHPCSFNSYLAMLKMQEPRRSGK